jgi:hypothetical protein
MKKLCFPIPGVFTKNFSLLFFFVFFLVNPELVFASEEERSMFAKSRNPSEIPDWMSESNQDSAYFGVAVASAGDVNGDGYSDVIVGAYLYDNGETDEGRVYVYHGDSSGLSSSPNWTAESNQAGACFGYSVSSGDVNGDGYSDVIVGACYYDNGETDEGRAYVYHGSSSGLSSSPDWTAESNRAGACFGVAVASAGDVNGDSHSDVIVGAYRYTNGETNEGGAYVYNGSSSGLFTSPSWVFEPDQADVYFGYSVSSAGDVNGDGCSDVIVGAYGYDNGEADEGRVYVFHGGSSGLSASPDWVSESNQVNSGFGGTVSSAGDVNGDGYSDVIVGAAGYDNGETDEGTAFLYLSDNSGIEDHTDYEKNIKLGVFPSISMKTFDIKFSISEEESQEKIILSVYNKVGVKIANLFTGKKPAGIYTVKWHGNNNSSETLSNDIYFISLKKGTREQLIRKILLLR